MRFISYAQGFEDLFIFAALGDYVNVGNYIDVGANDPVNDSVTKTFYDRGWSGINIEPLDDMCAYLEEERPRDINLCIGVGKEESEMTFHIGGEGSTFADETFQSWDAEHPCTKKKILPLQMVYDRYCSRETEIHFLKIDVEGFERDVLLGIDFSRLRPWLIVMEATLPGTTIPCHEKWEDILLDNGYVFAFAHGINRYYVANEKSFLCEKYNNIGKILNNLTITQMRMSPVSVD